MFQRIYPAACFLNLYRHQLTGFLRLRQFQHIRQNICQRFYRVVQIAGRKCKTIGINIIFIGCPGFVIKHRNIHAHNVPFIRFQINALLRRHQCGMERLLRHAGLCNDKVFIRRLNPRFHLLAQSHVFPNQIQKLPHQFISFILQKLMTLRRRRQLLLLFGQLHSGWVHLRRCQVQSPLPVPDLLFTIIHIQIFIINTFQLASRQNR